MSYKIQTTYKAIINLEQVPSNCIKNKELKK